MDRSFEVAAWPLLAVVVLCLSTCYGVDPATDPVADPTIDPIPGAKIIGGEPFDGLPAVGALTYAGEPFCTGTLIDSRTVLTAAHCVEDGSLRQMRFAIGPSAYEPEEEITVASVEMHPQYDPEELTGDLGLVHLSRDASMEPLALLDGLDSSWVGEEMLFVGYGMDDPDDEGSLGEKRSVTMPIEFVWEFDLVFGGRRQNICDGDSGSPVLYEQPDGEMLIAGVVSSGDEWCEEFGIATRVDPYFDFIFGEPADPCEGETYFGRCEGNLLIWCDDDAVQTMDCDEVDAQCELHGDEGYFCLQ